MLRCWVLCGGLATVILASMLAVRSISLSLFVTAGLFPAPPAGFDSVGPSAPEYAVPAEVLGFHERAVVVDTHADTTQRILYQGAGFLEGIPGGHLDLEKMRRGGVDAQFLSVFVSPRRTAPKAFFSESLRQVRAIHDLIGSSGGRLALARTAADVRRNAAAGVPSILLGVEGGHALAPGTDAERLEHLRRLAGEGVRYLTLTWTNSNEIGGSCGDEGDSQGLTDFGRRAIDEMHKLGVLVDLSHVSDPLFWDAVRYSRKPIILSHSSARAVANVPRNVSDAMLRAVSRNGGAVCVNFNPGFLDVEYNRAQAPIWAAARKLPVDEAWRQVSKESVRLRPVPLARLGDHIMHMVQVAGVDHVCLGSDFDGIPGTPVGLEDAGRLPHLTAELRRRGLSQADILKILGANTLRILEANEDR